MRAPEGAHDRSYNDLVSGDDPYEMDPGDLDDEPRILERSDHSVSRRRSCYCNIIL